MFITQNVFFFLSRKYHATFACTFHLAKLQKKLEECSKAHSCFSRHTLFDRKHLVTDLIELFEKDTRLKAD